MNTLPTTERAPIIPSRIRGFLAGAAPLGIGDAVIRVSNFVVTALVAHLGGPRALGVFALGQLTGHYLTLGADFGLKAIGSRLLAADQEHLVAIVREVQRKRALLVLALVPVGLLYAFYGPLPAEARLFVAASALAVMPNAFLLDWAMLGLERFAAIGAFRAGTAILFALLAAIGLVLSGGNLMWVAAATAMSAALAASANWGLWLPRARRAVVPDRLTRPVTADTDTRWRIVVSLGMATIFMQLFHTVDTFMLGGLSTTVEVGRYNAAYRILFVLFGTLYFFTQSMFPRLARMSPDARSRVYGIILTFACGGFVGAVLLEGFATPLIVGVYGRAMQSAVPLLRVLLISLPLECAAAFLGTALVAWGHERSVLWVTTISAATNIFLNLFLIPARGAMGAAIATLSCYVLMTTLLLIAMNRVVKGGRAGGDQPEDRDPRASDTSSSSTAAPA